LRPVQDDKLQEPGGPVGTEDQEAEGIIVDLFHYDSVLQGVADALGINVMASRRREDLDYGIVLRNCRPPPPVPARAVKLKATALRVRAAVPCCASPARGGNRRSSSTTQLDRWALHEVVVWQDRPMEVSFRLSTWIMREFPKGKAERVLDSLRDLGSEEVFWRGDTERLAAAIVLPCQGRWDLFVAQLGLARLDWRDVLVNGGLGNEDWPKVLNEHLG
jgi:hypothetical protein